MHRNGLIRAAACAALACSGLTGLAQAQATNAGADGAASSLALRPVYLQDQAATTTARAPLMALLDHAGIAKGLDDSKINVGGLIEGSYTYSASAPPGNAITGRLFDFEHEDPTLNQIQLYVERSVADAIANKQFDIGFRFEGMYGADARFIHGLGLFDHDGFYNVPAADPHGDVQFDLTQAYVDFAIPVGTGLRLRVGKFVTLLGQEVIDPSGNALYSHSFLFNYAIPLTHTGILGSYNLSDSVSIDAGITRGWDTALEDDNDTIDFLGRVSYKFDDKTTLLVSLTTGADQPGDNSHWRTVVDAILSTKVGDNLALAFNGDYGYEFNSTSSVSGSDAQWFGLAAYAGITLSPQATANFRVEYFNDDDGARLTGAVGGAGVFEATAGVALTPFADSQYGKNLVIRPEVRYDYASKNFYDGGTDRGQLTAAIDAYYKF